MAFLACHYKLTHNGRTLLLGIIQAMGNTVGRLQSLFPTHQFDVLIGSLLGDGRLECRSKGIRGSKTARFRVHHGDSQKEYVMWKYKQLKSLVSTAPQEIERHDKRREITETSVYFHTLTTEKLGDLHDLFYPNGRKGVPECISKILNPKGLAVWYMDDGSCTENGFTLNTHSFDEEEQQLLQEMLQEKFGVITTSVKDRDKYKLRGNARNRQDLSDLIRSYITPSMNHKIVGPRNDLS